MIITYSPKYAAYQKAIRAEQICRAVLIKGEDFEGEMPTYAEVYVHNTVPESTIDLSAGVATKYRHIGCVRFGLG